MQQKVWELEFGLPIPKSIDHINKNRTDNRVENLRAATTCLQAANQTKRDRPLPAGVFVSRGKYICSSIRHRGKNHYLGTFGSAEEASEAWEDAHAAVVEYEAAVARGESPPPPEIKVTKRRVGRPKRDLSAIRAAIEAAMQGPR
jgi:hypothetical protein